MAFGAFGAFGGGHNDNERYDSYAIGAEAQLYLNDITLYGQAGYFTAKSRDDDPNDAFHDAFFGRAMARWYMSPISRLQGEVTYASGKQDSNDKDMDVIEWGVRYDHVLAGLPLLGDTQVFLGYRGTHADNGFSAGDTGKFTDHTVMVGTSHHFGGSTMMETERHGAGLSLPEFYRWGGYGIAMD